MGQTDTDGEKTPTGSLSDDTQRRNGENMHVHMYMLSEEENFNTLLSFLLLKQDKKNNILSLNINLVMNVAASKPQTVPAC